MWFDVLKICKYWNYSECSRVCSADCADGRGGGGFKSEITIAHWPNLKLNKHKQIFCFHSKCSVFFCLIRHVVSLQQVFAFYIKENIWNLSRWTWAEQRVTENHNPERAFIVSLNSLLITAITTILLVSPFLFSRHLTLYRIEEHHLWKVYPYLSARIQRSFSWHAWWVQYVLFPQSWLHINRLAHSL